MCSASELIRAHLARRDNESFFMSNRKPLVFVPNQSRYRSLVSVLPERYRQEILSMENLLDAIEAAADAVIPAGYWADLSDPELVELIQQQRGKTKGSPILNDMACTIHT